VQYDGGREKIIMDIRESPRPMIADSDAGNVEIVGFDLGHGESALAYTRLEASGEPDPVPVQGRDSIITAVAEHPAKGVLIGAAAWRERGAVTAFHLRFKAPDLDRPAVRRPLKLFAHRIVEMLEEQHLVQDRDTALFVVGCPSGWREPEREAYVCLLREAGMTGVRVVPESRAAFLHMRESGRLDDAALRQPVLLIDIGSSTTDFTVAQGLESHPLDFGHTRLGGGLIDELLFRRTLDLHPQRERLDSVFALDPVRRARCELKCREAKETFFNEVGEDPDFEYCDAERIDDGLYFEPRVDRAAMDALLRQPLAELEGRGWIETFRIDLQRARDSVDPAPRLIILTGGAARMDFVLPGVRAIFPEATVIMDRAPELSIARGLARFGRLELKSVRFRRAILSLFERGEIRAMLDRHLPGLLKTLAGALAEQVIEAVVIPAVQDWRSRRILTLNQLETEIAARSEAWLTGARGRHVFEAVVESWFLELQPALQRLTDPICERNGIPRTSLTLSGTGALGAKVPRLGLEPVDLRDLDTIGIVVNVMVSMLVGHIAGGTGIALLAKGPVGWIIGFAAAFGVLLVGQEAAKSKIRDVDLWSVLRHRISDEKIRSQMDSVRPLYAEGLESALAEAARNENLTERMEIQLKDVLLLKAEDAVLRFG
jgi:molecular chaperone DnaK (HSP70)